MDSILVEIKKLCDKKRLQKMFRAIERQEKSGDFSNQPFLERLLDALNYQADCDREFRISRLRKNAMLRWPNASIQDFVVENSQQLSLDLLQNYASCHWVEAKRHIAITGDSGAGKTRLACALANEAINREISVTYFQFHKLVRQLEVLEKEDVERFDKLVKNLMKVSVLFIDDWGLKPLTESQANLLFEIIEGRENNSSLILTSQYGFERWGEAFHDDKLVVAILDRIKSYTSVIQLESGDVSWRSKLANPKQTDSAEGGKA